MRAVGEPTLMEQRACVIERLLALFLAKLADRCLADEHHDFSGENRRLHVQQMNLRLSDSRTEIDRVLQSTVG